ncbi:T9SS type B sorting domain-containing protein [Gaetbulibacter saemankumensis]|uniref:T9SS type B sorting domain-containing protein n=1 Tax=Gaetbulibacter saemankumensis TaxID=311208 RepID=UPI0003F5DBDB|nr:T9SS type B sorting domain-containing protein [Gaetbulibacter saemankumensis]
MFRSYRTITIALILCAFALQGLLAQSGSAKFCIDAEPLCALEGFSYPNNHGRDFAEFGPNYGCMRGRPNPSWFYLQIDQGGDITLKLEQSKTPQGPADLDVDFIIYGPFTDPRLPCTDDLTAQNIIDCNWSPNAIEYANITTTKTGEYYLLMITNYSVYPGYISVTKTAGTATTNCVIVEDPEYRTDIACEGETVTMDATTTNAISYTWLEETSPGSGDFTEITGQTTSTYYSTSTKTYRAEARNMANKVIKMYEFDLQFITSPVVPSEISDYELCDNQGTNDGQGTFDLSYMDAEILNTLDPNTFEVTYYDNYDKALNHTEPLVSAYNNINPSELIYVRIDNISTTEVTCFDVGSFNLIMHKNPEPILDPEYILCINTNGSEDIASPPLLDTGLSSTDYLFEWYLDGILLNSETEGYIFPTSSGQYSVTATDRTTTCSGYASTTVLTSEPPKVTAEVNSYSFIENNVVEVTATGVGLQDYIYRMDEGAWQTDGTFDNVSLGTHIFTVNNLSGCGETSISLFVIDYPLYFTPNGDGVHDTWHITSRLGDHFQATISIFDRYGKLIKYLTPDSAGWDGTFQNIPMPTSDYWFTVAYTEPKDNSKRIFKSHFALKR